MQSASSLAQERRPTEPRTTNGSHTHTLSCTASDESPAKNVAITCTSSEELPAKNMAGSEGGALYGACCSHGHGHGVLQPVGDSAQQSATVVLQPGAQPQSESVHEDHMLVKSRKKLVESRKKLACWLLEL